MFKRRLVVLLLAAVLVVTAFPMTALAEEDGNSVSSSARGQAAAEDVTKTKLGAFDDSEIIEEEAQKAIQDEVKKALKEQAIKSDGSSEEAPDVYIENSEDGSESFTGDWFSYTLTPNEDMTESYTMFVGLGNYGSTTQINRSGEPASLAEKKAKITRVEIAEGVTDIGQYFFYDFCALRSVSLPSTLTGIGKRAFMGCICLQALDIPNSVTDIGDSAFASTCLIPGSVALPRGCNAAKSTLARARVFYDRKSESYVAPGASEDTTYKTQFDESFIRAEEILKELGVSGMDSEFEKATAIYEWITANVEYDYDALEFRDATDPEGQRRYAYAATAHSALFAHMGICSGYVDLARMMFKEAGLRCVPARGGDHEWVVLEVNGKWYCTDPTWDAGAGYGDYTYYLKPYAYFPGHTWEVDESFFTVYPIKEPGYCVASAGDFEFLIVADHAAIIKYKGNASKPSFPETAEYDGQTYPVTEIAPVSFKNKPGIRSIEIPEGYEYLGSDAFVECENITSFKIPKSLKNIGAIPLGDVKLSYNGTYSELMESGMYDELIDAFMPDYIYCTDKKVTNVYNLSLAKVTVSPKSFVYDGKNHMPKLTITTADGKVLKEGVDFEIELSDYDRARNVEQYYVDLQGLGDYDYQSIVGFTSFKIVPPQTAVKKLKAAKKAMTVTWTKKTSQVKGYQIQYALNSSFTKGRKTITVKNYKTASYKIKKLKSKKTYYVRIRTYKYAPTYDDNLYSPWSKAKKVKVK